MEHTAALPITVLGRSQPKGAAPDDEASASGVSWSAVLGGAFVAAALSLILLALGTGLGLSSISPWSRGGISAGTVGRAAVGWVIAAQVIASAMGGYVAGRLRTKWATIHGDEVYFRDTAHGLLVWAVGTVMTAALLVSATATMAGGVTQIGSAAMSGAGGAAARSDGDANDPNAYALDGMFRSSHATPGQPDASVRAEVGRIFAHALANGGLSAPDKTYAASLVASQTGLSQAEAEQRVNQIVSDAQTALDAARKAAAKLSLWIFVALLAGAFCGSYAATLGGRQRDHVQTI